ncbi:MAG: hypothetical protein RL637_1240 [Pseudomonadota bacterium]|jgi:tRNA dimethylallyltransferase
MKNNPPAIILMGPTAIGKTTLAIQLAQALNGEIISVDSALVYRGMNIGTAKPDIQQRQGIPHHLIDILDPTESYSTAQFRDQALSLMQDIYARGKIPILVGGTMLYFKALLEGLAKLPAADAQIRQRLAEELATGGKLAQYQRLQQVDPQAAARIHPNDPQRIHRALEVYELCGQALSDLCQNSETPLPYRWLKFVLLPSDRTQLHQTIAKRFHQMLDQGLIEEAQSLYQRGDLHPQLPSMRAVGYRQLWQYLAGDIDKNQMIETAIIATRQLAKRQLTWLRQQADAQVLYDHHPNRFISLLKYSKFQYPSVEML